MKCLRFATLILGVTLLGACASTQHTDGIARDTAFAKRDVAPAKLTPPDFGAVATDPAFLKTQADYHFTMAETLAFEGHGARAAEEYKAALVYDPTSVHVRLRLAAEYVHLGMMTEAIEQGELASNAAPTNVEAHMLLGGIYAGLKLYQPARNQFQAILNLEPGHVEAALYLGALLAEEQKYDEAIQYFTKLAANAKFTETEKAYYYIGRVRTEQGAGTYNEAKRAFTKALSIKPEYAEAALALANLEFAQKDERSAELVLRSYQDKFGPTREMSRTLSQYYLDHSDFDRALAQLENVDGFERDNLNVKIQIALILVERKKYDQAAQRLEDILLLAPESDKVHYYLGAVYEETGRVAPAIEHYAKVPAESSYFVESVIHGAHLNETTGHLDRAVGSLAQALAQVPDQPALYAYYATLLDQRKDYATGVTMLTAATQRFPDDTQLRFFLGTMQDRVGNQAEAVAQMQHVIDADHDIVPALNYLAFTFAEQSRDLDQADDFARRALKLSPTDGYILDTVGWVQFKRGNVTEAIKYLEAALRQKPNEAIINEHLGDAYLRNQMWRKAQALYQKAMSLELDQARHSALRQKLENVQAQSARLPAGA
jgi:tetratricopeptide (TPR) repeat protein